MPPILPSGKYTISIPTKTETYYIGGLEGDPDAITILPGNVDPRPIFTLDNVDGIDEYNISIDGRLVGEKGGGMLCLEPPTVNFSEKWKITRSGNQGYIIKGGSGKTPCWSFKSFVPPNLDDFPECLAHVCPECLETCACSVEQPCDVQSCHPCHPSEPNPGFPFPSPNCSGCPSPCYTVAFTRVIE